MGILLLVLCFVLAHSDTACAMNAAIFRTEGQFFQDCAATIPLTNGARVIVFNDKTGDGRSEDDETLCGGHFICIPEESMVNFQEFYVSDTSVLMSPDFRVWLWEDPPTFYLCLLPWPDESIEWISPTIVLPVTHPDSAGPIVNIPRDEWTCDSVRFDLPMCQNEPNGQYFRNPDYPFEPFCVRVCPGYGGYMFLANDITPYNQYRVPVVRFVPGCEGLPAAHPRIEPGGETVFLSFDFWILGVVSADRGFAVAEYLDHAPCATIDTMTAVREGQAVRLSWTTLTENDLDSFEVWKGLSYNPRHMDLVDVIPATGDPQGFTYEYVDDGPIAPQHQTYVLGLVDADSSRYTVFRAYIPVDTTTNVEPREELPQVLGFVRNFPNPFNASTQIEFDLPASGEVILSIFDITGRLVTTLIHESLPLGRHTATFDGHDLASGLYFARLQNGENFSTHKMVLLK